MTEPLWTKSATELSCLFRERAVSPVEVMDAFLDRIEETDSTVNAFVWLSGERALTAARRAEALIAGGQPIRPLEGIPFGLKDSFDTVPTPTTSGARALSDLKPTTDSAAFNRLHAAGAILVGKLNMSQLAFDATGDNPDFGAVRNPWNPLYTTGGSSSGPAAAVASGACPIAIGTDTGGSVRVPAALCGAVGLKPTYGLVSRAGVTPMSWTMDHVGPITRTVEDCALVMNAIAGHDPLDRSTAVLEVPDYTHSLSRSPQNIVVGVPREFMDEPIGEDVKAAIIRAMRILEELGCRLKAVEWPSSKYARAVSEAVVTVEAASALGEIVAEHGSALAPTIKARIERGYFVTGVEYVRAQRVRLRMIQEVEDLFENVDVLIGPTVPVPACKSNVTEVRVGTDDMSVFEAYLQNSFVHNVTGIPSMTVPCGLSNDGLPIGLQIAGRHFDEATVLCLGHAFESIFGWPGVSGLRL